MRCSFRPPVAFVQKCNEWSVYLLRNSVWMECEVKGTSCRTSLVRDRASSGERLTLVQSRIVLTKNCDVALELTVVDHEQYRPVPLRTQWLDTMIKWINVSVFWLVRGDLSQLPFGHVHAVCIINIVYGTYMHAMLFHSLVCKHVHMIDCESPCEMNARCQRYNVVESGPQGWYLA